MFQQNACQQSQYVVLSGRGALTVEAQHSGHCPVPVTCVLGKVALGQLAVHSLLFHQFSMLFFIAIRIL